MATPPGRLIDLQSLSIDISESQMRLLEKIPNEVYMYTMYVYVCTCVCVCVCVWYMRMFVFLNLLIVNIGKTCNLQLKPSYGMWDRPL